MNTESPSLRIGIIGAGRVGSVLGASLTRAGHRVVSATARSDLSRLRAESLIPQARVAPLEGVVQDVDLIMFTVPDDALPTVVAETADFLPPSCLVMHTSGRAGLDVFSSILSPGIVPLAIHPVMTFTGTSLDIDRLQGCPFGISAPEAARPIAEALVLDMGGEPYWIADESRTAYHAALAHASNHLVTLLAQSMDALTYAGVSDPGRLLSALTRATLDNALQVGDAALTGPIMRADVSTVRAHVAALAQISPQLLDTYVGLARATTARALAAGHINDEQAAALLDVVTTPGGWHD